MIANAIGKTAQWGIKKIGLQNLLALTLLVGIVFLAGYGFSSAIRGVDYKFVNGFMLPGILTGWYAASRLKKHTYAILLLGITGLLILLISSTAVLDVSFDFGMALFYRLLEGQPWGGNWDEVLAALSNLGMSFAYFLTRPITWFANGLQSGFTNDPFIIQFVWGWAFWGASTWCSYSYRRNQGTLIAIAPLGGLLALTINYVRSDAGILIPFVAGILLLMAAREIVTLESIWERNGKDYSEELRYDTAAYAIFISAALTLFAWIVPSISVQRIARFISNASRPSSEIAQPLAESLGLEPGLGNPSGASNLRNGGLPRSHLIGSGSELEERVIMVISTGDLPSLPAGQLPPQAVPRYYWKSIRYSEYTGLGWQTETILESEYEPGEEIPHVEYANARQVTQHITGIEDLNDILYAAGTPVSADAHTNVFWRFGSGEGSPVDLFTIRINANDYRVTSSLPGVGEAALKDASTQYPDWIRETYLQLPDDLPERVRNLAVALTEDQDSVYWKAKAIESYLRKIEYTLDLPEPPVDGDIVDYFLFSLRRGYCDYYASSMVVMARTVGIPARLAIGFASGTYDPSGARYVVTAADAHSWPEIYFPEYGWIEFEPTGGQAPLDRALTPLDLAFPAQNEENARQQEESMQPSGALKWIAWLAGFSLLIILVLGLAFVFERRRLHAVSTNAAIARLYKNAQKAAVRMMKPYPPSQTPSEFAENFTFAYNTLKIPQQLQNLLVPIIDETKTLVEAYNRTAYSMNSLRELEKTQLIRAWERMRLRFWLLRLSLFLTRQEK